MRMVSKSSFTIGDIPIKRKKFWYKEIMLAPYTKTRSRFFLHMRF